VSSSELNPDSLLTEQQGAWPPNEPTEASWEWTCIAPSTLYDAALPLASFWWQQGHFAMVVKLEDVPGGAAGIRDYRWQSR
jgi:hypothetical protein